MPREKLENRRRSLGFDFRYIARSGNETRYKASLSLFDDGRPAEIFIDARKIGSDETAIMRDAAVLTSIALQHGVPLKTLLGAVTRLENGAAPASPIGAALDALHAEIQRMTAPASASAPISERKENA